MPRSAERGRPPTATRPSCSCCPTGEFPRTADVLGANTALIGLAIDRPANRVVVVTAVDNLVKGTAGAADPVDEHRARPARRHRAHRERSRAVSVTAPQGFEAAGVAVGLKSTGKPDVAVVVNRGPLKVGAAVFTSNRAKANPIIWSQQVIQDGVVEAIVLNSGGANCFTGSFGFQTTHQTAEKAAELLGVSAGDVLICSTGLIGTGDEVFRAKVLDGTEQGIAAAQRRRRGRRHPLAIMTTDSKPKRSVVSRGRLDDRRHGEGRRDAGPRPRDDARRDHHRRRARRRARPTPRCGARRASRSTGSTPTAACRRTTR